MSQRGIQRTSPLGSHLWPHGSHIEHKSVFLCSCILHLLSASLQLMFGADIKRRNGCLLSDIRRVLTHSHTSSDCGDYQHFTVFSVSNENEITGNVHLRPSKTLHFISLFYEPVLTLWKHLTMLKHPPG